MHLLLVSSNPGHCDALARILENTPWRPIFAFSADEAASILETVSFPIILWDRNLPGIEWKAGLRRVSELSRQAALLLLSEVADTYLWEEVVSAGGFEVMPTPFRPRQTLALIEFAHRHWEASRRDLNPA